MSALRMNFLVLASALAAVAPARLVSAEPAVEPAACLADWSDAAPVVARERLLSARDVRDLNRRQNASDIVRITLCREPAGYVYRVVLRDAHGRISVVTVDAQAAGRGE